MRKIKEAEIFFDIDGTFAYVLNGIESDADPRAIEFKKHGLVIDAVVLHFIPHDFITLIQLLDQRNIRFDFFSAGTKARNIILVETVLKLALGESRYQEIAPSLKILSRDNLTVHPLNCTRDIKDLCNALNPDDPDDSLENIVLVDDDVRYAHPDQTKNLLLTPTQSFNSDNLCDNLRFSILYISGVLFTAIENAKASGSSLTHELFRLQHVDHGNGRYKRVFVIPPHKLDEIRLLGNRYLYPLTTMEEDEQKAREAIDVEVQTTYRRLQTQIFRNRLFVLRSEQRTSDADNPILQHVAYGKENDVKAALEAVKNNPMALTALLFDTGTVKDYSNRTMTDMTLLQAAVATGDIDMCLMLKNYLSPEEFSNQLADIFPHGIEAHEEAQKRNAFNFDAIYVAILTADARDLDAALAKQDNSSELCLALKEFRRQFSEVSHNEKIFNPQHLLSVFKLYDSLWDQCESDGYPGRKKTRLFWRQVIGYIQRFMPTCYIQAYAQGLYNLVKVNQGNWWRPTPFCRPLKLECQNFTYFPLPIDPHLGLGFDFAIPSLQHLSQSDFVIEMDHFTPTCSDNQFSETFIKQKQKAFRTLWRECECSQGQQCVVV